MAAVEGKYGGGKYVNAGAPVAGTNEVQTLTIDATGGTFKVAFEGFTSSAITWSSTNSTLLANIQAALDALASLGTNEVVATAGTLTAGVGTILLTFSGTNHAKMAVGNITVANNSLTGTATCSIAETTPGVDATARGLPPAALLLDTTNNKLYINTGTALSPTFTVVGAQT